jgi:NADPH:quinone reductase-like Zn-dependent oxidoreductase
MQALQIEAYDSRLRLVEKAVPIPKNGQVLIRIATSPINPYDLMFLRGEYGIKKRLPIVPGFEASGIVVDSGTGIRARALVGRQVACGALDDDDGTWAEYMVTAWNRCLPILTRLNPEQSAMLLVNPLTALALLEIARRGHHHSLVQTAAASALGRMILALAKQQNITTINIVRRSEQVQLLKSLGAEHVIDMNQTDFDHHLRELCQRFNTTIAFETVAGELTGQILGAMPQGAKLIVVGAISRETCKLNSHDFIFEGKSLNGFWLSEWFPRQSFFYQIYAGLRVQILAASKLKSDIRARVPLEKVVEAIEQYESRMTEGKILIVPGLKND